MFLRITASQTGPDLILTIITLSWDGIGPQVIAIVIIPNNLYNEPPLNYRIYFILRIWPSCFIKEKSTKSKESNKTEKTDHAPHRTLRVVLSKVSFLACDCCDTVTWGSATLTQGVSALPGRDRDQGPRGWHSATQTRAPSGDNNNNCHHKLGDDAPAAPNNISLIWEVSKFNIDKILS